MIRLFTLISIALFFISCKNDKVVKDSHKQKNLKDYIDFPYDKVIAFATVNPMDYYDGNFDKELDVKKLKDTISITLNSVQIKDLNDILSGRRNQEKEATMKVSDCFYPRHNIIFLNQDKIVNHITVCFECNQVKGSKTPSADMKNYQDFFGSLGLKVFDNPIEHSEYYDSIQLSRKKSGKIISPDSET